MELKLREIYPNPNQPRKTFNRARLEELAESIKGTMLMEPLVVVKRENGYMLVAGERRWRACRIAGLETVPVRVIGADDREVAELALIENLQREDLNLIEEANGYQQLMDQGCSMDEVAQKMGFKQTWRVQERLNLLKLDPVYQDCLVKKIITPSQAQEMSRLSHRGQRILFDLIGRGKADTYNKVRSLAGAILNAEQQISFLPEPAPRQKEVKQKYDRILDSLVSLIDRSFSKDDLTVLKSVLDSSVSANIQKIDLSIDHLRKIKRALQQAQSTQEVLFH